jgi:cytidylate kinase
MKVDLLKYMSDRMNKEDEVMKDPGPVITISRDFGCPSKKIAIALTEALNKKREGQSMEKKWRWINKEIMHESARELELEPEKIRHIFDYKQKSLFEELISAHSNKYYKSDKKIKNTIAKVIRNIGTEGHAVIVGRAGVVITKHIPKSLHIHLEAPLEWRALRVSEKEEISLEEARERAKDIDKKRLQFREYYEGGQTDYTWFDLSFNCMTLSVDEIVSLIMKSAELRSLL